MEQHHIELMFAAIGFVIIMLTTQSFLTSVIVFSFWVLFYKYVCKSFLCPSMSLKSKGVMRLAESGDVEGLRRELAKGLSINTRDENNSTFLHWAAANAQVEMVEFLIKHGININAVNNNNCTALHITSALDRLEIARLLVENGANKDIRSKDDKTPLECAVSNPMKIILQVPLFHKYSYSRSDSVLIV